MNQQEFDAACVELRSQLRAVMANIREDRAQALRKLEHARRGADDMRDAVRREFQDRIYDLASEHSTRSSAFVAGQAAARVERDKALMSIEDQWRRHEDEYWQRSRELQKLADKARSDSEQRKAEVIKEYEVWLAGRRAQKAQACEQA